MFYHLSVPGDAIAQPSFAVHAVFTQALQFNGRPVWVCETGYETLDYRFDNGQRGMRVLKEFALGICRKKILKELQNRTHYEVLRILRIRDYRRAQRRLPQKTTLTCYDWRDRCHSTREYSVSCVLRYMRVCCHSSVVKSGKGKGRAGDLPNASRTEASVLWRVTDAERRQWLVLNLQELDSVL